jgi:hypothetical protein
MTPDLLERELTLRTAVARFDQLRSRADLMDDDPDETDVVDRLTPAQALELLALGEVIARKAGYGRQLDVRLARAVGGSWSQIGAALGTSKQAAWESHTRWIDHQADRFDHGGVEGFAPADEAAARSAAGDRP